jgi:RimJ/RimL family protein N-acetyltransferase
VADRHSIFVNSTYLFRMDDSMQHEPATNDVAERAERHETSLPGHIRRLWPGEEAQLRDHLLRLDPESRRSRFGSPVNRHFIEHYASRALRADAIVHGFFADGDLRGVAELRAFGKAIPFEAEAAFSLERAWQGRGIGNELLERTILSARNRGIRSIHLNCLAENRRMQAIAKKHEAHLRLRADEVIGEVVNPGATPLSMAREWMSESFGLATAILDVQRRAFDPA